MRIELAGSATLLDRKVLTFTANQNFDAEYYRNLGYTHFEVICIGGGGGSGGGINTDNTGTLVRNYGGAGGGGGFHRVKGLLSVLPDLVPVVVGSGGAAGAEHVSNPANTTDGADGGASSFNGTTCRASGGKGGKRAQSNSLTVTTQAHGGAGGVGNSVTAGGGAAGGVAGTPTATGPGTPGTNGADGDLVGWVGKGGGGGAGGVGKWNSPTPITANAATSGGKGAYSVSDQSVYSLGGSPRNDLPNDGTSFGGSGAANIVPGFAGGARPSPLNGLPQSYGRSSTGPDPNTGTNPAGKGIDGIVVVCLTAE